MHSIKPRFSAVFSGSSTVVYYNGARRTFTFESEEENSVFYASINTLYKEGRYEQLETEIDPERRFDLTENIEKDRSGNYFVKGISIPLPQELLVRIKKFLDMGISVEPLINFWKLLSTNPDEQVRTDLFKFADRFSFPITDSGYFIAYKAVAWKGTEYIQYAKAVSSKFIDVIGNGHNPEKYIVIHTSQDEVEALHIILQEELDAYIADLIDAFKVSYGYDIIKNMVFSMNNLEMVNSFMEAATLEDFVKEWDFEEPLWEDLAKIKYSFEVEGNLRDVYTKLLEKFDFSGEDVFTDWYSRKSTIKLGQAVTMKREDCDNDPNVTCSRGLHVGAPGYVSNFGHGGTNYILACLVSPANVVAVPYDYDFEKMRACEYFPFAICEFKDGEIEEVKTPYFENDYMSIEKDALEAKLLELEEARMFKNSDDKLLDQEVKAFESRLIHLKSILSMEP